MTPPPQNIFDIQQVKLKEGRFHKYQNQEGLSFQKTEKESENLYDKIIVKALIIKNFYAKFMK